MSSRRTQKRRVRTRLWPLNETQNIRFRSHPAAVENDIFNRIFALTANKRRVKTPETPRDLKVTLWSLKMLETPSKPKPRSTNLILINCVLGGSVDMRGKSLLNEKAIIILCLNQSECLKLLRSASSMWWGCHVICNTSTHAAFIAVFHRPEQSSTGGYERIIGYHWTYRHSTRSHMIYVMKLSRDM